MSFFSFLKRCSKKKKIGLVLGAGGARGYAHAGVLKVLQENNVPIHCIVGSSAGALIGGLYSANVSVDDITTLITEISMLKLAGIFLPSFEKGGLVRGEKIKKMLEPYVGGKRIENLPIKFSCNATDLHSGAKVIFKKGDLINAVRASISIPGIFTPVSMNGKLLIDGGVVDPLPVAMAKNMGADFIVAVNVIRSSGDFILSKKKSDKDTIPKILDLLGSTVVIFQRNIIKEELKLAGEHVLIEPKMNDVGIFDFRKGESAIKAGIVATQSVLHKIVRKA